MRQEIGCLVAVPDLLGAMGSRAMEHVLSAQLVQRQDGCSCVPQALHEKIEYNLIASYVSCVAALRERQHTSHNTQGDTMIEIEPIYTTEAIATGAGRDGHVQSSDGRVVEDLAVPVEMGGNGRERTPSSCLPLAMPHASTPPCSWSPARRGRTSATPRWVRESRSVVLGRVSVSPSLSRSSSRTCRMTRPSNSPTRPTRCAPTPMPPGATFVSTSPSSTTDRSTALPR